MPSNYPAGFDSLGNPLPTDDLDSLTVAHADLHSDTGDAVQAVQSTLGLNPQGPYPNIKSRLDSLGFSTMTSTTDLPLQLGPAIFAVNTIGWFSLGARVRAADPVAVATKWMEGPITLIDGLNITITVDLKGSGTGTVTHWVFSIGAGAPGAKGDEGDPGPPGGVVYLDGLLDVTAPTPADKQALLWDAASSQWKPGVVATGAGGDPAALEREAKAILAGAVWNIDALGHVPSQTVKNLGWGGAALDAKLGSTVSADGNDPKFLDFTGTSYVYLPVAGVAGNRLTVPDSSALDVTGDIDLRACLSLDDWTAVGAYRWIIAKWATAGNQRSYMLAVRDGGITLAHSVDGTASAVPGSTATFAFAAGTKKWIRATRVAATGVVTYYTSDDGVTWTQLGTTVVSGVGAGIFASTTGIEIGGYNNGNESFEGKVHRVQIFAGLTGADKRLDIDCGRIVDGAATSFPAVTGQTVTINRSTTGRKAVAVVAPVWLFGTDDFIETPDDALLDFTNLENFTVLVVTRHTTVPTAWGALISKIDENAPNNGYAMRSTNASYGTRMDLGDSAGHRALSGEVMVASAGLAAVRVMVRDGAGNRMTPYLNGTVGVDSDTSPITSTLANTLPLRIGAGSVAGGGAGFAYTSDMEFAAAAIFRRALTADEIKTLSTYYASRSPIGSYLPLAGGQMTGELDVVSATAVPSASARQIHFSTALPGPSDGADGDLWVSDGGVTGVGVPTPAAPPGMVCVKRVDFSLATTVPVDNVFTAEYDDYLIVLRLTAATGVDQNCRMRLRAAGVDNSAAMYTWQSANGYNGASVQGDGVVGDTSWKVGFVTTTFAFSTSLRMELLGPAAMNPTTALYQRSMITSASQMFAGAGAAFHNVAAAYDGFDFYPDAGNVTGRITVYGLRKAP